MTRFRRGWEKRLHELNCYMSYKGNESPAASSCNLATFVTRVTNSVGKQLLHGKFAPRFHIENRCAEAAGRRRGEFLEKVREGFFHARRILDFNAGHFQSQNCKTHGHAMIVVG